MSGISELGQTRFKRFVVLLVGDAHRLKNYKPTIHKVSGSVYKKSFADSASVCGCSKEKRQVRAGAAIALLLTCTDLEYGGEMYGCATDREKVRNPCFPTWHIYSVLTR